MYPLFITLAVIIAVLLVIVVLLQASKGGGLAGSFGGSGQFGTVFGTRRTADFLSKATWWLGGTLMALAIIINLFFLPKAGATNAESVIQGKTVPAASSVPQQQAPQPTKK